MKKIKILLLITIFTLASCTNKFVPVVDSNNISESTIDSSVNENNQLILDNISVARIDKYGNIVLDISDVDFLNKGFQYEDMLTVSFLDRQIDMPLCKNFFEVTQGEYVCAVPLAGEANNGLVIVAICMGDFATTNNLATKVIVDNELGYEWHYVDDSYKDCLFSIELKERGGHHIDSLTYDYKRSSNRDDYKNLTDEEFANFRMIKTTGIGDNKVYRSSSPVNPKLGRNEYAMKATEEHGIKTIINLADINQEMLYRDGYTGTYYSNQKVIAVGQTVSFGSDDFNKKVADAIRFMIVNDTPYLIHCDEGKDRAGIFSAFIECIAGASFDEIIKDYMITYYNYYNVLPDTVQYNDISKNIINQLSNVFGIDDLKNADLSKACENYFISLGLTTEEIQLLKQKLQ